MFCNANFSHTIVQNYSSSPRHCSVHKLFNDLTSDFGKKATVSLDGTMEGFHFSNAGRLCATGRSFQSLGTESLGSKTQKCVHFSKNLEIYLLMHICI